MKNNIRLYILGLVTALLSACSANKFIPEGQYLLDDVEVISENKNVPPSSVKNFIRQKPNSKWFNLMKVPLGFYCLSSKDSSHVMDGFFQKIGEAPEIYDHSSALKSRNEIEKAIKNRGYMQATVRLDTLKTRNKVKAIYRITTGKPYIIRHIAYAIDDVEIHELIEKDSLKSLLREGMVFHVETLDRERTRITKILRNNGYYKFNKDYLVYEADTVRNTFEVDIVMKLLPYRQRKEDIPTKHRQYIVRNVNYSAEDDVLGTPNIYDVTNTMKYKGLNFYYDNEIFLRPNIISNFNFIQPGKLYHEDNVQNTYASLGRLRALKYTNINFNEVIKGDSAFLDANVTLTKGKNQSLSFEIEGTNSAGNLGAAASLTFQHRNVFKGAETFTAKLHGGFEAITKMDMNSDHKDYKDYGVETSLNFPEFKFPFLSTEFKRKIRATSEIGANFNLQVRPEFHRTLASASWSYRWTGKRKSNHRFDLLNISYVYFPWTSSYFSEYLAEKGKNNISLLHSYDDQLIVQTGYSYTYNSANDMLSSSKYRNSYSIRLNLEESGNVLHMFSKLIHSKPKEGDKYKLANLPYAQYIKADIDLTQNLRIDNRNSLVFHIGLGVAYPYGNSETLPFEKQYFSGGPNSVRGWSVRSLGPGSYKGVETNLDYYAQVGDIKLDMNIEYRTYLFWKLHGAFFIDAGNIWTITDYLQDEDALFRFNRFYKQLAMAYGLGIRFDFDFLILRFDGGMKAINPMYTGKDKYPILRPNFDRDFTFHFAVGYPF